MKCAKVSFSILILIWKLNGTFGARVIRAPKVLFNFHFKIEMEKDIFAHLNFDFKIKNWKLIKIFQFSFFNFYWKIENWKFIFHVSIFKFNCQITQVDKSWLAFFKSRWLYIHKKERKNSIVTHLKESDIEIAIRRK